MLWREEKLKSVEPRQNTCAKYIQGVVILKVDGFKYPEEWVEMTVRGDL